MDEEQRDLVRLLNLIETYTAALDELESLGDPGVADLAAQLETLRAQAAVEAFGRHTTAEVDRARRALADYPIPYVPGNRSASRRTSSAAGSPTTFR